MKFLTDLKKIVFVFLFLFFHGEVFGQTLFENQVSDIRLSGKIGAGMLEFSIVFPLALEFEKSFMKFENQKLLWLLQVQGGFSPITRLRKPQLCSEGNCSQTEKTSAKTDILLYGSVHAGLRYNYLNVLTTSVTLGTLFLEPDFIHWLTTLSIGWNIMDKAHVEFHAGFPIEPQFFKSPKPILLALSVGFPLKTW